MVDVFKKFMPLVRSEERPVAQYQAMVEIGDFVAMYMSTDHSSCLSQHIFKRYPSWLFFTKLTMITRFPSKSILHHPTRSKILQALL